jgi:hypothetical protein
MQNAAEYVNYLFTFCFEKDLGAPKPCIRSSTPLLVNQVNHGRCMPLMARLWRLVFEEMVAYHWSRRSLSSGGVSFSVLSQPLGKLIKTGQICLATKYSCFEGALDMARQKTAHVLRSLLALAGAWLDRAHERNVVVISSTTIFDK